MSNLGNGLNIKHVVAGVANRLDKDGLGLVVNGGGEVLEILPADELGVDPETGEEDLELVVGSPVQVASRDDVVTGMGESGDGEELGGLA